MFIPFECDLSVYQLNSGHEGLTVRSTCSERTRSMLNYLVVTHNTLYVHTHTYIYSIFDCPMRFNIYSFLSFLPVFHLSTTYCLSLSYSINMYTCYFFTINYHFFFYPFSLSPAHLCDPNSCASHPSKYCDILSYFRFILTLTMTGT